MDLTEPNPNTQNPLTGLKHRRVRLACGEAFQVPPYVVRIDTNRPGGVGLHGWQVTYATPTKYFSDSATPDRNPRDSFESAVAYLKSIWTGPRKRKVALERIDKASKTGAAGVRVKWRRNSSRGSRSCWVVVSIGSRVLKQLYVGTEGSFTEDRLAARLAEGVALRRAAEEGMLVRQVVEA